MEAEELYAHAINKWGVDSQMEMAVEECAELIQALQKLKRVDPANQFLVDGQIEKIASEVADVEIMCEQLRHIFGDTTVDKHRQQKLLRLEILLKK